MSVPVRDGLFRPDDLGFVRHWLICGPSARQYEGPPGEERLLATEALDPRIGEPPPPAARGRTGPLDLPWRYLQTGQNVFVEVSHFYHHRTLLDLYAQTLVVAPKTMDLHAALWSGGAADLWVNGRHVARLRAVYRPPVSSCPVVLPLHEGVNRLDVRVQCFGARETRHLLGLQIGGRFQEPLDREPGAQRLHVRLPGDDDGSLSALLVRCERWLACLAPEGGRAIVCRGDGAGRSAPPVLATVRVGLHGPEVTFGPDGRAELPERAARVTVTMRPAGERLDRTIEIPRNHRIARPAQVSVDEHRHAIAARLVELDRTPNGAPSKPYARMFSVMMRAARGLWRAGSTASGSPPSGEDDRLADELCDVVDRRGDCADFILAGLLRMLMGSGAELPEATRERIRRTALAFRYWPDESGSDAMWFWSENHSLLFHGCQAIAGAAFPDESFAAAGRTGSEQARIGLERCRQWLDKVEEHGFEEYLSGPYMPITAAALANLVDLAPDEAVQARAAAVLDGMFRTLALHAFDGVVVGPQARSYRDVLRPEASGRQAMLHYATPGAVEALSGWLVFLATSRYQPPSGLEELMRTGVCRRYRQSNVEIVVEKTEHYCLSSLAIPSSMPGLGEGLLLPGGRGYQEQVWAASLGRDCHVFASHPGATWDLSTSRPGYWYGNAVLPAVSQHEGRLTCTWDIGPEHVAGFTHAHWPADAFDEQEVGRHWAFGRRGGGYIGLWCSGELRPHDDALVGRELRALGRHATWVCVCGRADRRSFAEFRRECLAMEPGEAIVEA